MLDVSADNLRLEAESAIKLRQVHTQVGDDITERIAGNSYRSDWTTDEPAIEKHEFEFLTNIKPAVMSANPSVSITSRRPVVQRELVQAMQHGVSRWIKDVDLEDTLSPVIDDAVIKFGAVLITMEPMPGHGNKETPPLRPMVSRVSPKRFFMDPQAERPELARFMGHIALRDRDDMINAKGPDGKAKYNKAAIEALAGPGADGDSSGSSDFISDMDINVFRDQVITAEIFVPETGMIYSIGFSTTKDKKKRVGVYLREPRKYFGHPRGPYILFGFYIIPDQVYPMSPLCVTAEVVRELNAHAEQSRRQASTARTLVLVDSTNVALTDAIVNFEDGTVAAIPNFNKAAFAEVSIGGPDAGTLEYMVNLRDRVDRISGLTDIQRGQVSGKATATEAQLAAAALSGRVRFMQKQIQKSVKSIIENAAWLMYNSRSVVFPVSKEKAEKLVFNGPGDDAFTMEGGEEEDSTFLGGPQEGQEDFSFFDLELNIDPYSMEQVDEAVLQKRMEIAAVTVTKFAPLMLQLPFINWPDLLDDYFQSINIPDGRKYINYEMLMKMLNIKYGPGLVQQIAGLDGTPGPDLQALIDPTGGGSQQAAGGAPQGEPVGAGTGSGGQQLGALLGGASQVA